MARHAARPAHARQSRLGALIGEGSARSAHAFGAVRGASPTQMIGAAVVGLVLAGSIPAFAASNVGSAAAPPPVTAPIPAPPGPPAAPSIGDFSKAVKTELDQRRVVAKARADRAAARKAAAAKKVAAKKKAALERKKAAQRKAKAAAAAKLAKSWVWPLTTPRFGARFGIAGDLWASGKHTGQDFPARTGTGVRAAGSGTVVFAGEDGPYGNVVRIEHKGGIQTWYGHLSAIEVKKGQKVTTSKRIGKVGSTGNSTGPHLHFEVRPSETADAVDPVAWMKKRGVPRS